MIRLGRIIATVVAISSGILVLAGYFVESLPSYFVESLRGISTLFLDWAAIVIAFSLLLGLFTLLRVHLNKVLKKEPGRIYSIVLISSVVLTLIAGVVYGGPNSAVGQGIFIHILRPLEATIFAMMVFFIASAAYRAFRIKNFETFLFVAFAIIVLLGQVPAGYQLWADFPLIKEWVMAVPILAGTRGILLGVALGTIATAIRILLGADRPYADG